MSCRRKRFILRAFEAMLFVMLSFALLLCAQFAFDSVSSTLLGFFACLVILLVGVGTHQVVSMFCNDVFIDEQISVELRDFAIDEIDSYAQLSLLQCAKLDVADAFDEWLGQLSLKAALNDGVDWDAIDWRASDGKDAAS